MDWIGKWDWENLAMFNPNTIDCSRKNPSDWGVEEEDENGTSFGGGVCSGSDLGHGSSARSSITVETSSKINGINISKPTFVQPSIDQQSGNPRDGEPEIGLKLGKRTYFENSSTGSNNAKTDCVSTRVSKSKSSNPKIPSPRCQVEGCNLDLSSAKEYHRKHRVCDAHSKSHKVVVGGFDRRFCQQCSRFHSLLEFDEKKRSCRRRLSDHNARRRKTHQEAIQFSSSRVSATFLDGGHQISFILNRAPIHERRSYEIPSRESSSKLMLTKEYHPWRSESTQPIWQDSNHLLTTTLINEQTTKGHLHLQSNSFANQGLKRWIPSSSCQLVPASDYNNNHALSLLSTNKDNSCPSSSSMLSSLQSFPMASPVSQYWQQPAAHDPTAVLEPPDDYNDIYSNILNK